MQELKKQISEIFIKWNLPTRQSAINEIMELFKICSVCGYVIDIIENEYN